MREGVDGKRWVRCSMPRSGPCKAKALSCILWSYYQKGALLWIILFIDLENDTVYPRLDMT